MKLRIVHADRLESNKGQFASDVMKMLLEGNHITVDEYIQAKKQIKKIRHEFKKLFNSGFSAILVPTTVILAPKATKSRYKNRWSTTECQKGFTKEYSII